MRSRALLFSAILLFGLGGYGCEIPTGSGGNGDSDLNFSSTIVCAYSFNSTGCHNNIGIAVQIYDGFQHNDTRCYDVYLNDYSCKHPGSPICFGPNTSGTRTVGAILAHWPILSSGDIRIVPQGTQPSHFCVWRDVKLNDCEVQTLRYTGNCG
jgi:hypothetical protein